jgi:hypothetical protein
MGIVINKPIPGLTFSEVMKQLKIDTTPSTTELPILYGGPVETGRGFVLHSGDYEGSDSTLPVSENISLTATLDILRAIADGAAQTCAVRARLCGLGAGPGRGRVPKQWLAALRSRSQPRIRRQPGRKVAAALQRWESVHPVGLGRRRAA